MKRDFLRRNNGLGQGPFLFSDITRDGLAQAIAVGTTRHCRIHNRCGSPRALAPAPRNANHNVFPARAHQGIRSVRLFTGLVVELALTEMRPSSSFRSASATPE